MKKYTFLALAAYLACASYAQAHCVTAHVASNMPPPAPAGHSGWIYCEEVMGQPSEICQGTIEGRSNTWGYSCAGGDPAFPPHQPYTSPHRPHCFEQEAIGSCAKK